MTDNNNPSNTNSETALIVDSSVRIPRDEYALRVLGGEYKKSQKDQWMFVLDIEITGFADGRETFRGPGGNTYQIVGQQFTHYVSLSPKALANSNGFLKKLDLPTYDTPPAEDEVDCTIFDDLAFTAILSSKEDKEMKEEWDETLQAYKKVPMTDSEGKQIIAWRIQIYRFVRKLAGLGFNG